MQVYKGLIQKYWACSQENESRSKRRFGMWFWPFPDLKAWFYPLWRPAKQYKIHQKVDCTLKEEEEKEEESSFVCVHFGNAHWSLAWVNHRRLRSRNKILPRSAQILFVIWTAFAMHVNAHSLNHDPNHKADRDPKHLLERDSFLCEHSHS